MITTDAVRLQDVAYWISDTLANRYGKKLAWEWLKGHWEWLRNNLGGDLSFYMMPRYVARSFSDRKFLPEFEKFFKENLTSSYNRPLDQAIETIKWQSQWKERDLQKLIKYYSTK